MGTFRSLEILWHYLRRRHGRRFSSREELTSWQEAVVPRFIGRVRAASPFYAARFAGYDSRAWRTFPTLDKAQMMASFDLLNTAAVSKGEAFAVALAAEASRDFKPTVRGLTVGMSSGTSGTRGLFLVAERETRRWAGTMLAKALPPSGLRERQRIALCMRAGSNLYESVGSRRLSFQFFDMVRPLPELIEELARFEPTILIGPPLVLAGIAAAQEAGRVRLAPRKVIAVAEVLDDLDRARIGAAFGGQVVHQIYQCTEGFLGITCAHGTLHLNEDCVAIDPDWIDGRRFAPVITDFSRFTQPIIRYRLDDILVERETPCPCGSPMRAIERIEGRCDDSFVLKTAAGVWSPPVFPDLVRNTILAAADGLQGFTAEQTSGAEVCVSLALPAEIDRAVTESRVAAALAGLARRYQCTTLAVRFAPYVVQPGIRKLRRVSRSFSLEPPHA